MASPPVSDDVLLERVAAFQASDRNQVKAADALGISRGCLQQSLKMAAQRGFMGTSPVLAGFQINKTSTQLGPDGELQREWIQQTPEPLLAGGLRWLVSRLLFNPIEKLPLVLKEPISRLLSHRLVPMVRKRHVIARP